MVKFYKVRVRFRSSASGYLTFPTRFDLINCNFFFFGWCVYLQVCTPMCMCEDQMLISDVFQGPSPLYFFETRSLSEPGTHCFSETDWLPDPPLPPSLPPSPSAGTMSVHCHTQVSHGLWGSEPRSTPNTLVTELWPQLSIPQPRIKHTIFY